MRNKTIPQINNVIADKKFFSSSLKSIFPVTPQSSYSSGDIIHVIRNAISSREYIETYVMNSNHNHIPSADTEFVHIVYYPDRKRHDFSLYTNINVNEGNVREIAEMYRERLGIENSYLKKKDAKERTHSPDMGVMHFLFYLSVLVYNMLVLLNLIRRMAGYGWITLMDFIISMGRSKLNIIMKGNG